MTRDCILMFNGDGVEIPPQDKDEWSNYKEPDSMKLAWIAKYSWQLRGFNVLPFTIRSAGTYFTGRLRGASYRYNGFIPSVYDFLKANQKEGVWFTSIDVMNQKFGFGPMQEGNVFICLNHTFSLGCGYITMEGCEEMMNVLDMYDCGELKRLQFDFDEHVLRTYYTGKVLYLDYTTFAPDMSGKIIHFSRSTLRNFPQIQNYDCY